MTFDTVSCGITLPLTRTVRILLGWMQRSISLRQFCNIYMRRSILAPPLVEPAHAPKNISTMTMASMNVPHEPNSGTSKPVDEIIDTI